MKASVEEIHELNIDIESFVHVPTILGNLTSETSNISGDVSIEMFEMSGAVEPSPVQEVYEEDYEIDISMTDDIVLPTKGKVMNDNIVVKKVPVTEVSNESGGYTLTIG